MDERQKELKGFKALSNRERQVLSLAAAGMIDKQIGQELGVSVHSLRTYWARIRGKVGEKPKSALVGEFVLFNLQSELAEHLDPLRHEGWVMDAKTRTMLATDTINDAHGLERGVPHPAMAYMRHMHPEDAEKTRDAIFAVAEGDADSVLLVYRLVTPRGVELVHSSVHALRGPYGDVRKVYAFRIRALDTRPEYDPTVMVGRFKRRYPEEEWHIDDRLAEILRAPDSRRLSFKKLGTLLGTSELASLAELTAAAVKDGRERLENDMRLQLPDGRPVWFRLSRRIERKDDGSVTIHGTVNVFH